MTIWVLTPMVTWGTPILGYRQSLTMFFIQTKALLQVLSQFPTSDVHHLVCSERVKIHAVFASQAAQNRVCSKMHYSCSSPLNVRPFLGVGCWEEAGGLSHGVCLPVCTYIYIHCIHETKNIGKQKSPVL
jgi:hypothetical protein